MNSTPNPQQVRVQPHRSMFGQLAFQSLVGILAAAFIGAAAVGLRSHGEATKQVTAQPGPQVYLISSPAAASPILAQSSPFSVSSDLKATPPQSTFPALTPLAGSASNAAGRSPEQEQIAELLRGFLAVVEQDIEELKTSIEQLKTNQEQLVRNNSLVGEQLKAVQEQMVRDAAVVAEQLKATQEQMARLSSKESEQQMRPKTAAPPPRSITTLPSKPMPKLSSQQTRVQPPAPVRGRPE